MRQLRFMRRQHKLRVQWFWWLFKWIFYILRRVIWSDVCTGGRNPTSKLGMRESMGGDFFKGGGGGVSLNIIIMWGRVEIDFCLMRGGYDLVWGHISPISQPPPTGNYYTVPNWISCLPSKGGRGRLILRFNFVTLSFFGEKIRKNCWNLVPHDFRFDDWK